MDSPNCNHVNSDQESSRGTLSREIKGQRRNPLYDQSSSSVSPIVITDEPLVDENCCRWTGWDVTILATKFILWSLMMALAVHVEFGAVFFVITLFYIILTNFKTSPRKRGELSAYSVFNPNFETIHGTVTPEQFERQLLYGAL